MLEDEFTRRGMSAEQAHFAARRALGSAALAMDGHRDARSFVWLDDLRWDVGYAARLLRKSPAFALTAVVSLAVGIGANTTIFTIANALLFRAPIGVVDPGRLVDLGRAVGRGNAFNPGSYPDYLDLRARTTTLDGVYATSLFPIARSFAVDDSGAEQVFATPVSQNYFAVLGVTPAAGRLFEPTDSEAPGASPIVVVSHRFWQRRFGQNASIVGRTVRIDMRPFTIVGVAPEGFHGTGIRTTDIWIPFSMTAGSGTSILTNRASATVVMGGRLKPGVSVAAAAGEAEAIAAALAREHPQENRGKTLRVLPASPVPGTAGPIAVFMALLTAIASTVLIVACANLAGVLLARAAARRREIAVRLAIGAGRARLVRQLITEALLLFAFGGAAGLALARAATTMVLALLPAFPFPIDMNLALDARIVAFTVVLSLAAALAAALVPALQASKTDSVAGLRDDTAGSIGKTHLRHAFLIAQVAFSIVLVVVGGLFARALQRVGSLAPGFDASNVEVAAIDLAAAGYSPATAPAFVHEMLDRIRRSPSVESATVAAALPSGFERISLGTMSAVTEGAGAPEPLSDGDWNIVEPGYFATVRMAMLAGRDFSTADRDGTQPVVILGAGAARRLFPDRSAVGEYVVERDHTQSLGALPPAKQLLVVGVAADPTYGTLVDGLTDVHIYLPLQQHYLARFTQIVARSRSGQSVANDVRAVVRSMNPNVPVGAPRRADEVVSLGLLPQRIVAAVAGSLGLVGLMLAALGLYGVTAYSVGRRTREFGVRIALGATRRNIFGMVVREAVGVTLVGSIAGLVLAAGAAELIASQLFGVTAIDWPIYSGAAVLFMAVAVAACCSPARRAVRIEPVEALRRE
jgi:predicted permease